MSADTNFLEASQNQQGIYSRKRRIFALLQQTAIGTEVLAEILPNGNPLNNEVARWQT